MDWLDLLAVQGTLMSLLKHHSSKASIFWHSAFFTVQLSHPYMTTGKTIALTRRTFVGKVMSLLFNMLSRVVMNRGTNFISTVLLGSAVAHFRMLQLLITVWLENEEVFRKSTLWWRCYCSYFVFPSAEWHSSPLSSRILYKASVYKSDANCREWALYTGVPCFVFSDLCLLTYSVASRTQFTWSLNPGCFFFYLCFLTATISIAKNSKESVYFWNYE